jgi:TolA-binding protein
METVIYDTHKRVVKLDQDLQDSISNLNETAAQLSARVETNDQQTRKLRTLVEDNAVKVQAIQRDVASLKSALYRQILPPTPSTATGTETGTPGRPSTFAAPAGSVIVEPPAGPR